jgi:hypothetical protein
MAVMPSRRLAITLEISALSAQQITAVQKATFVGWEVSEMAAYEERTKRMALLRAQLAEIDPTIDRIA